jgi:hypothetical protein
MKELETFESKLLLRGRDSYTIPPPGLIPKTLATEKFGIERGG